MPGTSPLASSQFFSTSADRMDQEPVLQNNVEETSDQVDDVVPQTHDEAGQADDDSTVGSHGPPGDSGPDLQRRTSIPGSDVRLSTPQIPRLQTPAKSVSSLRLTEGGSPGPLSPSTSPLGERDATNVITPWRPGDQDPEMYHLSPDSEVPQAPALDHTGEMHASASFPDQSLVSSTMSMSSKESSMSSFHAMRETSSDYSKGNEMHSSSFQLMQSSSRNLAEAESADSGSNMSHAAHRRPMQLGSSASLMGPSMQPPAAKKVPLCVAHGNACVFLCMHACI